MNQTTIQSKLFEELTTDRSVSLWLRMVDSMTIEYERSNLKHQRIEC